MAGFAIVEQGALNITPAETSRPTASFQPAVGDIAVWGFTAYDASADPLMTGPGVTWTRRLVLIASGGDDAIAIFECTAADGTTDVQTVAVGSGESGWLDPMWRIIRPTDLEYSAIAGQNDSAEASVADLTVGPLTTDSPAALLAFGWSRNAGLTIALDGGWTLLDTNQTVTGGGTNTLQYVLGDDAEWVFDPTGNNPLMAAVVEFVSAGGSTELEVAEATHAHAADSPALTQASVLAAADATHGHAADAPALVQAGVLATDETTHAHAADGLDLVPASLLEVDEETHDHTVDSPTVTQAHILIVADATHAHSADAPALTQAYVLVVADALHAHAAEKLNLVPGYMLAVADALHAHVADVIELGSAVVLSMQDGFHAHAAEEPSLVQAYVLAVQDALHAHGVDALLLGDALTVAEALHTHDADNVALIEAAVLAVADALHGHGVDNITFSAVILYPLASKTGPALYEPMIGAAIRE